MTAVSESVKIEQCEVVGLNRQALVVNMSTRLDSARALAGQMFGYDASELEVFPGILLTSINAPPEYPVGSLGQTINSTLALPSDLDGITGVIITGSPFAPVMLNRDWKELGFDHKDGKIWYSAPWMVDLARFINKAYDAGKPMLGICFGMQIMTEALGGKVARLKDSSGNKINVKGWELITKTTGADPGILGHLPDRFVAPQNHKYGVEYTPPGAVALAESGHGLQAYRLGTKIFGIQFHPEKTPETVDETVYDDPKVIKKLEKQGVDIEKSKGLANDYKPVDMQQILRNFAELTRQGVW